MKKIMIVSALVLAIAGISTAQADDQRGQDQRGGQGDHRGGPQQGNRGGPQAQGQRFHAPAAYARPHGYQARSWRGGDRLPAGYRGRQYYVNWRQYHLSQPPFGYQWVRIDNDVVLVAIGTGVIMSVVPGLYY